MRSELTLVTPEMAGIWLQNNRHNRFLSPSIVAELAAAIVNDTWQVRHQGIALAPDGTLVDGQHRLAAIVRANKGVYLIVNFDVDPATFTVIDAGKKRTISDVISVERGHPYAGVVAAACRCVLIYDRVELTDTASWGTALTTRLRLDRGTTAEHTLKIADEVAAITVECKHLNPSFKLTGPVVAALYVIRRDTKKAGFFGEFVRGVITGEGLEVGDVRGRLRDVLLSVRRGVDDRLLFFATVKAWNLNISEMSVKLLRFAKVDMGIRPL